MQYASIFICICHTGKQFKIIITFSGHPPRGTPIQTYGLLQITLIDKNGLNETYPLTR